MAYSRRAAHFMHLYQRIFIAVVLALLVLAGILWATGGTRSDSLPAPTPTPTPPPTPTPAALEGQVATTVTHLSGSTWRFRYVIRDTGDTPIGGFQISGNAANLFHVVTPTGWAYTGSYCGQHLAGILIYWSTSTPHVITAGRTATFGFDVNTSGTRLLHYSMAYGNDTPQFATIRGPAGSDLKASGRCGR